MNDFTTRPLFIASSSLTTLDKKFQIYFSDIFRQPWTWFLCCGDKNELMTILNSGKKASFEVVVFIVHLTSWLNTKHVYFNCLTWLIKLLFYKTENPRRGKVFPWLLHRTFPRRKSRNRNEWEINDLKMNLRKKKRLPMMKALAAGGACGEMPDDSLSWWNKKVIRRFISIKARNDSNMTEILKCASIWS